MKGATLFSGGEGIGIAMRTVGIEHLWGIEYDNSIADVARTNGFHSITADIRGVEPQTLERPDVLHASPECKRASNANVNATESEYDIECATAVCRFIHFIKPRVFTLENVYAYRQFASFKLICDELRASGYHFNFWHLNAANYGVPQTRKRLILIASLDARPQKPIQTHTNKPVVMFDTLKPWVGWYAAIKDLIPTLPESEFAEWQLKRLPKQLPSLLVHPTETRQNSKGQRDADEPSFTVTAGSADESHPMTWLPKAFITNGQQYKRGDGLWESSEPAPTIRNRPDHYRAFLTDARNGHGDAKNHVTQRAQQEPAPTVNAETQENGLRALLLDGANAGHGMTVRRDDETRFVITSDSHRAAYRAFLMDGQGAHMDGMPITRDRDAPSIAVTSSVHHGMPLAWLQYGRVVKMTPRALARFQSFPDSYELPDNNRLACTVIGNAVPPLLYERILLSLVK